MQEMQAQEYHGNLGDGIQVQVNSSDDEYLDEVKGPIQIKSDRSS